MILLVFVVAGIVTGLLARGRFSNLGRHGLRGLWLCILSFVAQGAAAWVPAATLVALAPLPAWQMGVALLRYGLLLAFVVLNLLPTRGPRGKLGQVWPWVFGAGTLANAAVILTNGGAMPVAGRLLADISPAQATQLAAGEVFGYTLQTTATRLAFLGDVLYIGAGGWSLGFASIGDLLIGAGAGLLVFWLLRPPASAGNTAASAPTGRPAPRKKVYRAQRR